MENSQEVSFKDIISTIKKNLPMTQDVCNALMDLNSTSDLVFIEEETKSIIMRALLIEIHGRINGYITNNHFIQLHKNKRDQCYELKKIKHLQDKSEVVQNVRAYFAINNNFI